MYTDSKKIAILTIFASLYSVLVIFLAPISFSVYQFRLADALLPLSIIFGIPSALGFGLGALVSNFISGGLGLVDVIGGTVANLVACSLAYYIGRRKGIINRFFGTLVETLIISFIVGGYLSVLFDTPFEIGIFGVLIGSIISINLIGFPIQEAIRKNSIYKKIINK
jgi:uncharacterized membrane protein